MRCHQPYNDLETILTNGVLTTTILPWFMGTINETIIIHVRNVKFLESYPSCTWWIAFAIRENKIWLAKNWSKILFPSYYSNYLQFLESWPSCTWWIVFVIRENKIWLAKNWPKVVVPFYYSNYLLWEVNKNSYQKLGETTKSMVGTPNNLSACQLSHLLWERVGKTKYQDWQSKALSTISTVMIV